MRGIRQIFFLFLHENICCGYSLEAPQRGASNEYPQHMFSWRNKKKYQHFLVEKAPYLKLSMNIALNKRGILINISFISSVKCVVPSRALDKNDKLIIIVLFLPRNLGCEDSLEASWHGD